ncbi:MULTISPECIES: hypothetical protein [unclassified Prochlorococcus]|uniref:hypothetical protein n=1 Tax=unclassified Prochlorococcus TaxID=2627481 RepID=UPI000533A590|nr:MULTISPECIES: hypothetical protein [unclassified Prochlorococcus]KGG14959.1 hypothetical protein EV06_2027 [Prochlorococcus sp. MIT 0602]KGG15606.1 hypothetical protein EV07_1571 [Prochlorococcus sp. MIT 0603]
MKLSKFIYLFPLLLCQYSIAHESLAPFKEKSDRRISTLIANSFTSDKKAIKTVTASGYGTSLESAAQNAAENALTQVVGSFMDAETQIKKQKEIRDGVISRTKIIKKDIRDYSQGSIKYFEILNIQQNGSIFNVTARVDIRIEDFRVYIRELAKTSKEINAIDLFTEVTSNLRNLDQKRDILFSKVLRPLENQGEIVTVDIGNPIKHSDFFTSNFCKEWIAFSRSYAQSAGHGHGRNNLCNPSSFPPSFDKFKTFVIPVTFLVNDDFIKTIESTLDNISDEKRVTRIATPAHMIKIDKNIDSFRSKGLFDKENDYTISIIDMKGKNFTTYILKDVKHKWELQKYTKYLTIDRQGRPYPKTFNPFRINIYGTNNQLLYTKEYDPKDNNYQMSHYCTMASDSTSTYYCKPPLVLVPIDWGLGYYGNFSPLHGNYIKTKFRLQHFISSERKYLLFMDLDLDIMKELKAINIEFFN